MAIQNQKGCFFFAAADRALGMVGQQSSYTVKEKESNCKRPGYYNEASNKKIRTAWQPSPPPPTYPTRNKALLRAYESLVSLNTVL